MNGKKIVAKLLESESKQDVRAMSALMADELPFGVSTSIPSA